MNGYKQAYTLDYNNVVIVELDIPDDAKVIHTKTYGLAKDLYRCDRARVVAITSFDGRHRVSEAISMKDGRFRYRVGEMAYAQKNESIGKRPGIYFFRTRQKAIDYEY